MPLFDFECCKCKKKFESIENQEVNEVTCECGYIAKRIFPTTPANFKLGYNPKTDICDWDGNTTQYYRQYNEAKDRGENVRLPEEGE